MCESNTIIFQEKKLSPKDRRTEFCGKDCQNCVNGEFLEKGKVCAQDACGG